MSTREPRIELARRAVRDLRRIDGPVRRRIHQAFVDLADGIPGLLVARVVNRRDLLRAVHTLDT